MLIAPYRFEPPTDPSSAARDAVPRVEPWQPPGEGGPPRGVCKSFNPFTVGRHFFRKAHLSTPPPTGLGTHPPKQTDTVRHPPTPRDTQVPTTPNVTCQRPAQVTVRPTRACVFRTQLGLHSRVEDAIASHGAPAHPHCESDRHRSVSVWISYCTLVLPFCMYAARARVCLPLCVRRCCCCVSVLFACRPLCRALAFPRYVLARLLRALVSHVYRPTVLPVFRQNAYTRIEVWEILSHELPSTLRAGKTLLKWHRRLACLRRTEVHLRQA